MNKCNGCGANLDWTNNVFASGAWIAQCKYCGSQAPVVQRPSRSVTIAGSANGATIVVGSMNNVVGSVVQISGGDIK